MIWNLFDIWLCINYMFVCVCYHSMAGDETQSDAISWELGDDGGWCGARNIKQFKMHFNNPGACLEYMFQRKFKGYNFESEWVFSRTAGATRILTTSKIEFLRFPLRSRRHHSESIAKGWILRHPLHITAVILSIHQSCDISLTACNYLPTCVVPFKSFSLHLDLHMESVVNCLLHSNWFLHIRCWAMWIKIWSVGLMPDRPQPAVEAGIQEFWSVQEFRNQQILNRKYSSRKT